VRALISLVVLSVLSGETADVKRLKSAGPMNLCNPLI
jgi:hypothetical protein